MAGALLDGAAEAAFGSMRFAPPVSAALIERIDLGRIDQLVGRSAARFESVLLSSIAMPTTRSPERSTARRRLASVLPVNGHRVGCPSAVGALHAALRVELGVQLVDRVEIRAAHRPAVGERDLVVDLPEAGSLMKKK